MSSNLSLDYLIQSYGDLVYGLCRSLYLKPTDADFVFCSILKKLGQLSRSDSGKEGTSKEFAFKEYERSWVLRVSVELIKKFYPEGQSQNSAAERIQLDSYESIEKRFQHFSSFFRRLPAEDQILLLLKDKFGIPNSEIAASLSIPEGTLKMRRKQALRALEQWLWSQS